MLNYEVDERVLSGLVPAGTELDPWDGRVLVSLVGFRFLQTRVLSVPVPFHRDFDEINLRFYVRRRAEEGWRRGVVFVKEIVPRALIALVARKVYHENYVRHPTVSSIELPSGDEAGVAEYGWFTGGSTFSIRAEFSGVPAIPEAGSESEFIAEHYWGYSAHPHGHTVEYRVTHPQWRVWSADTASFAGAAEDFYGTELGEFLVPAPRSAFVAEGSPVTVYRGYRI